MPQPPQWQQQQPTGPQPVQPHSPQWQQPQYDQQYDQEYTPERPWVAEGGRRRGW